MAMDAALTVAEFLKNTKDCGRAWLETKEKLWSAMMEKERRRQRNLGQSSNGAKKEDTQKDVASKGKYGTKAAARANTRAKSFKAETSSPSAEEHEPAAEEAAARRKGRGKAKADASQRKDQESIREGITQSDPIEEDPCVQIAVGRPTTGRGRRATATSAGPKEHLEEHEARHDADPAVDVPKKQGRGRGRPSKVDNSLPPSNQEVAEVEPVSKVETKARTTRGRKKQADNSETDQAGSPVEEDTKVAATPRVTRGRRASASASVPEVAEERVTRGGKRKVAAGENQEEELRAGGAALKQQVTTEVNPPSRAKRARGSKKDAVATAEIQATSEELPGEVKAAGNPPEKSDDGEPVKATRGRGRAASKAKRPEQSEQPKSAEAYASEADHVAGESDSTNQAGESDDPEVPFKNEEEMAPPERATRVTGRAKGKKAEPEAHTSPVAELPEPVVTGRATRARARAGKPPLPPAKAAVTEKKAAPAAGARRRGRGGAASVEEKPAAVDAPASVAGTSHGHAEAPELSQAAEASEPEGACSKGLCENEGSGQLTQDEAEASKPKGQRRRRTKAPANEKGSGSVTQQQPEEPVAESTEVDREVVAAKAEEPVARATRAKARLVAASTQTGQSTEKASERRATRRQGAKEEGLQLKTPGSGVEGEVVDSEKAEAIVELLCKGGAPVQGFLGRQHVPAADLPAVPGVVEAELEHDAGADTLGHRMDEAAAGVESAAGAQELRSVKHQEVTVEAMPAQEPKEHMAGDITPDTQQDSVSKDLSAMSGNTKDGVDVGGGSPTHPEGEEKGEDERNPGLMEEEPHAEDEAAGDQQQGDEQGLLAVERNGEMDSAPASEDTQTKEDAHEIGNGSQEEAQGEADGVEADGEVILDEAVSDKALPCSGDKLAEMGSASDGPEEREGVKVAHQVDLQPMNEARMHDRDQEAPPEAEEHTLLSAGPSNPRQSVEGPGTAEELHESAGKPEEMPGAVGESTPRKKVNRSGKMDGHAASATDTGLQLKARGMTLHLPVTASTSIKLQTADARVRKTPPRERDLPAPAQGGRRKGSGVSAIQALFERRVTPTKKDANRELHRPKLGKQMARLVPEFAAEQEERHGKAPFPLGGLLAEEANTAGIPVARELPLVASRHEEAEGVGGVPGGSVLCSGPSTDGGQQATQGTPAASTIPKALAASAEDSPLQAVEAVELLQNEAGFGSESLQGDRTKNMEVDHFPSPMEAPTPGSAAKGSADAEVDTVALTALGLNDSQIGAGMEDKTTEEAVEGGDSGQPETSLANSNTGQEDTSVKEQEDDRVEEGTIPEPKPKKSLQKKAAKGYRKAKGKRQQERSTSAATPAEEETTSPCVSGGSRWSSGKPRQHATPEAAEHAPGNAEAAVEEGVGAGDQVLTQRETALSSSPGTLDLRSLAVKGESAGDDSQGAEGASADEMVQDSSPSSIFQERRNKDVAPACMQLCGPEGEGEREKQGTSPEEQDVAVEKVKRDQRPSLVLEPSHLNSTNWDREEEASANEQNGEAEMMLMECVSPQSVGLLAAGRPVADAQLQAAQGDTQLAPETEEIIEDKPLAKEEEGLSSPPGDNVATAGVALSEDKDSQGSSMAQGASCDTPSDGGECAATKRTGTQHRKKGMMAELEALHSSQKVFRLSPTVESAAPASGDRMHLRRSQRGKAGSPSVSHADTSNGKGSVPGEGLQCKSEGANQDGSPLLPAASVKTPQLRASTADEAVHQDPEDQFRGVQLGRSAVATPQSSVRKAAKAQQQMAASAAISPPQPNFAPAVKSGRRTRSAAKVQATEGGNKREGVHLVAESPKPEEVMFKASATPAISPAITGPTWRMPDVGKEHQQSLEAAAAAITPPQLSLPEAEKSERRVLQTRSAVRRQAAEMQAAHDKTPEAAPAAKDTPEVLAGGAQVSGRRMILRSRSNQKRTQGNGPIEGVQISPIPVAINVSAPESIGQKSKSGKKALCEVLPLGGKRSPLGATDLAPQTLTSSSRRSSLKRGRANTGAVEEKEEEPVVQAIASHMPDEHTTRTSMEQQSLAEPRSSPQANVSLDVEEPSSMVQEAPLPVIDAPRKGALKKPKIGLIAELEQAFKRKEEKRAEERRRKMEAAGVDMGDGEDETEGWQCVVVVKGATPSFKSELEDTARRRKKRRLEEHQQHVDRTTLYGALPLPEAVGGGDAADQVRQELFGSSAAPGKRTTRTTTPSPPASSLLEGAALSRDGEVAKASAAQEKPGADSGSLAVGAEAYKPPAMFAEGDEVSFDSPLDQDKDADAAEVGAVTSPVLVSEEGKEELPGVGVDTPIMDAQSLEVPGLGEGQASAGVEEMAVDAPLSSAVELQTREEDQQSVEVDGQDERAMVEGEESTPAAQETAAQETWEDAAAAAPGVSPLEEDMVLIGEQEGEKEDVEDPSVVEQGPQSEDRIQHSEGDHEGEGEIGAAQEIEEVYLVKGETAPEELAEEPQMMGDATLSLDEEQGLGHLPGACVGLEEVQEVEEEPGVAQDADGMQDEDEPGQNWDEPAAFPFTGSAAVSATPDANSAPEGVPEKPKLRLARFAAGEVASFVPLVRKNAPPPPPPASGIQPVKVAAIEKAAAAKREDERKKAEREQRRIQIQRLKEEKAKEAEIRASAKDSEIKTAAVRVADSTRALPSDTAKKTKVEAKGEAPPSAVQERMMKAVTTRKRKEEDHRREKEEQMQRKEEERRRKEEEKERKRKEREEQEKQEKEEKRRRIEETSKLKEQENERKRKEMEEKEKRRLEKDAVAKQRQKEQQEEQRQRRLQRERDAMKRKEEDIKQGKASTAKENIAWGLTSAQKPGGSAAKRAVPAGTPQAIPAQTPVAWLTESGGDRFGKNKDRGPSLAGRDPSFGVCALRFSTIATETADERLPLRASIAANQDGVRSSFTFQSAAATDTLRSSFTFQSRAEAGDGTRIPATGRQMGPPSLRPSALARPAAQGTVRTVAGASSLATLGSAAQGATMRMVPGSNTVASSQDGGRPGSMMGAGKTTLRAAAPANSLTGGSGAAANASLSTLMRKAQEAGSSAASQLQRSAQTSHSLVASKGGWLRPGGSKATLKDPSNKAASGAESRSAEDTTEGSANASQKIQVQSVSASVDTLATASALHPSLSSAIASKKASGGAVPLRAEAKAAAHKNAGAPSIAKLTPSVDKCDSKALAFGTTSTNIPLSSTAGFGFQKQQSSSFSAAAGGTSRMLKGTLGELTHGPLQSASKTCAAPAQEDHFASPPAGKGQVLSLAAGRPEATDAPLSPFISSRGDPRTGVPPRTPEEIESYDLTPYKASCEDEDSDDEEEERRRRNKPVPRWAKEELHQHIARQRLIDPDQIFCCPEGDPLENVFGKAHLRRMRGVSGDWSKDGITETESAEFRTAMGYQ